MFINESGKGRRVRCPICNCMFTIESAKDYKIEDGEALLNCPDCGAPLTISLEIPPKQDVFVAGRN